MAMTQRKSYGASATRSVGLSGRPRKRRVSSSRPFSPLFFVALAATLVSLIGILGIIASVLAGG